MGLDTCPGKTRTPHSSGTVLWFAVKKSGLVTVIASLGAFSLNAAALEAPVCRWKTPQTVAPAGEVAAPVIGLQQMLAQLPDCQKNPQFLANLGQMLNSQSRFVEAADHLELALLLDPDLKDAQLSYAIALAGSGDISSAKTMFDRLLSDPDLPVMLRPLLLSQQAQLTNGNGTLEPPFFQKRFTLASRLGYDSNLLGSPNLNSLALTFPGQTIVLPLSETYLARPAAYGKTELQLELNRTTPGGARWDAMASLRSRYSPTIHTAGYQQIDLSIERSDFTTRPTLIPAIRPAPDTPASSSGASMSQGPNQGASLQQNRLTTPTYTDGHYANASVSAFESNSGTRFMATGLGAGWAAAWQTNALSTCQARSGLEWQERNHSDNKVLSGRYTGFSLTGSCQFSGGAQLTIGLKAGKDRPSDAARPGGTQQQTSLKAATYLPQSFFSLGAPFVGTPTPVSRALNGFLLDMEISQQRDSNGYSPIVDSGRSRIVSRLAARIEYQYNFSRSFQAFFGVEWVEQASSIALFGSNSRGGYSGLRSSW